MCVCLNGKLKLAVHVFGQPQFPPTAHKTPTVAVHHAGRGVEDSQPACPHAVLSAGSVVARKHVFAKKRFSGKTQL